MLDKQEFNQNTEGMKERNSGVLPKPLSGKSLIYYHLTDIKCIISANIMFYAPERFVGCKVLRSEMM